MLRAPLALSLALLVVSGPVALAADDGVTVTVRRHAPDALEVGYVLPAGCTRVGFFKEGAGAAEIRSRWESLDGASAGGDALTRDVAAPGQARFRVPVTSDKVEGYPGSFPVGAAIYAHMSNYAVGEECGPVRYRFAAAGVTTARSRFERVAEAHADAPALLFLERRAADDALDHIDPALGAAVAGRIREVAEGAATFLRARMPAAQFDRPVIAAGRATEPGGPNIGGSAGEILLLSLFNWPDAPEPGLQRLMVKLVAHEMSHGFQMRDAVDVYPDSRLIHEGGAEFLRWGASIHLGWLAPEQAAEELDDALAACMLGVGDRRWRDVPAREAAVQRLEYSCGLAAYVYALALRQGDDDPFARIDGFYQQLRAGAQPDFAKALECGPTECRSRVLSPLLSGEATMSDQWSAILDASGLAVRKPPSQSQVDAMMLQAITRLVRDDCGGRSSITPTRASILIDRLRACRSIQADIVVERVEGLPVFGSPDALTAMIAACGARGAVTFGLKDGGALTAPCREPYSPVPYFYAADIEKVIRSLDL